MTHFLLGRGASYSYDGSLCFTAFKDQEVMQTLAKKLVDTHTQSAQGSFKPDKDRDKLILALGNKEHSGRTQGVGVMVGNLDSQVTSAVTRVERDPK